MFRRVNLTKLDAWGLKAEFESGLAKVEALAEQGEDNKPQEEDTSTGPIAFLTANEGSLADFLNNPEGRIILRWGELERKLHSFANSTKPEGIVNLVEAASVLGLSEADTDSLMTMRDLRNQALHSPAATLTAEDVKRFYAAAHRLESRITSAYLRRRRPK
jgi:hypothetical protein